MNLNCVTISGADNQAKIEDLVQITSDYPFVEWGILLADHAEPRPQYPDAKWRGWLAARPMFRGRLSGHICGKWAREICMGKFPTAIKTSPFSRIQLNVVPYMEKIRDMAAVAACLSKEPEWIIQVGPDVERGLTLARQLRERGVRSSVLFDASGGQGIARTDWPAPPTDLDCGFAGGLGPDTLADTLQALTEAVGDRTIWIDMQSRVRTLDGVKLDLTKVRTCLEIAKTWVVDPK